MGATDVERQKPNVFRMKLLGAEVRPVTAGHGTLKDAMNEALRDWVTNVEDTYYLIGTAAGPHPYPEMVRDFQSVIGIEARAQILEQEGRLPDALIAASAAAPTPSACSIPSSTTRRSRSSASKPAATASTANEHCASMTAGAPGVLHGNRTYLLQDADGQILDGHSISAGLDYPGVGPEHSWLHDTGRVELCADHSTTRRSTPSSCTTALEGIIPALESGACASPQAIKIAPSDGQGPDHHRQPFGPRRQGRAHGGRACSAWRSERMARPASTAASRS